MSRPARWGHPGRALLTLRTSPAAAAGLTSHALERFSKQVHVCYCGAMKRPHASDDVRERALAAVDDGHRVGDVAEYFRVDPSTIRRSRRQRTETGTHRARPRPGRARLIGPAEEPALEAQVAAHPDATLAEQCQLWEGTHGVVVSVPTMGRALARLRIMLKKRP
jgi:transposase